MGRTACTGPQCLYSTAIPLLPLLAIRHVQSLSSCTVELYLYSPNGPYGLYRASVPVQGCIFPLLLLFSGRLVGSQSPSRLFGEENISLFFRDSNPVSSRTYPIHCTVRTIPARWIMLKMVLRMIIIMLSDIKMNNHCYYFWKTFKQNKGYLLSKRI